MSKEKRLSIIAGILRCVFLPGTKGAIVAPGANQGVEIAREKINQLINAEADSTRVALLDYKRPTVTITLPRVNAFSVAQLLYKLEVQTAIAGELYNINTFNQPGVEQAKNYTYALMGRAGYEESAKALTEKMAK